MRLTISKYYLPSGKSISEVGVTPDILVEEEDDGPKQQQERVHMADYDRAFARSHSIDMVFYCTADARSDSENLQKFLKKWLFWTYLVSIISKSI